METRYEIIAEDKYSGHDYRPCNVLFGTKYEAKAECREVWDREQYTACVVYVYDHVGGEVVYSLGEGFQG